MTRNDLRRIHQALSSAGHSCRRVARILVLVGLASIYTTGSAPAAPISTAESPLRGAVELGQSSSKSALAALRQGEVEQALHYLRQAHRENPDLAPAEILLANMYLAEGKPTNAKSVLEQAAVKYPDDPEPHLMFADLAWRERRLSDAHVQYEHALELVGRMDSSATRKQKLIIWALAGNGSVAETRGKFDLAGKYFKDLLQFDPAHTQALNRLGHIYFAMDRPSDALAQFRASGKGMKSPAPAELTLATLFLKAGKFDEAQHWIEQAMASSPEAIEPLIALARFYLEVHNDPIGAEAFIKLAAELDPEATDPQLLRGSAAWHRGDLLTAEKEFEAIVFKQPSNIRANVSLASVLAEQGNPERRERAWELVQLTARAHPQSLETATALGWVAYLSGKWKQAEQQLRAVAKAPNAGRDAQYYLARALFRQGQITAARKALTEALDGQGLFIHLRDARQWQLEIGAEKSGN